MSVLLLEAGADYRSRGAPAAMQSHNHGEILLSEEYKAIYQWPDLVARRSHRQEPAPFVRGRGGGWQLGHQRADRTAWGAGRLPIAGRHWVAPTGRARMFCLPSSAWRMTSILATRATTVAAVSIPLFRVPEREWGAVDLALKAAAIKLGYGWAEDYHAPESTGISPVALTMRDDRRVSTNDAYVEPARARANLEIIGGALVDRVEFDTTSSEGGLGQRRRAVGVRVGGIDGTTEGKTEEDGWSTVHGREILLCAGAVHSPAVLMRSGIGAGPALKEVGVTPVVDLPGVGQNLLDHPTVGLHLKLQAEAQAGGAHARRTNCCIRYSSGLAGTGRNDMLMASCNVFGIEGEALTRGMIVVSVFQAFSQGQLRIASADPQVEPVIEEHMLSDRRDLVRLRDGVRRLFSLGSHPACARIAEEISVGDPFGGESRSLDSFASDEQLDRWLLEECVDCFHIVGTCRMGAVDDRRTVVDPDCRVVGVDGLRVIDASIMPEVPRANTHLTTVMIAEHMAERLRTDRGTAGGRG